METLRTYYQLTKPGIIYGNIMTAIAGFLLAAKGHIRLGLLLATLVGTSLVIASACVFNNYIDQGIDKKMSRTKKRALVQGTIRGIYAIVYAICLGVVGFFVLGMYTNGLVVLVGAIAIIDYVVLYGITKRTSVYGTIVGSISGAAPIVAGYVAVTDHFDSGAFILFLILALWQMPHFYSIAIYRYNDYKAAGLPVLPVKKGMHIAKIQIMLYIVGLVLAVSSLSYFGYAGYGYLLLAVLACIWWFWFGLRNFIAMEDSKWARKMFLKSLLVILTISFAMGVNSLLP